jgi:hypothetical protein
VRLPDLRLLTLGVLTGLATMLLPCAAATPPASSPFAPEQGPLRIQSQIFKASDGATWDWRGVTMFTAFARYLRGEDITPQLDWCREHGVNVIRVFGQTSGEGGWASWPEYRRPWERPGFARELGSFFDLIAAHGLRVEYTVLTFPDSIEAMHAGLQRAYEVAAGRWNVLIEAANEPEAQGIDVLAAMRGVDRHGVLSAYGLYQIDPAQPELPHLDYVTVHSAREAEFAARANDLREVRVGYRGRGGRPDFPGTGTPVIGDEPIGVAEAAQADRRTTSAVEMARYMAVCRLAAAGCTLHLQAGLDGRTPDPTGEPVQREVARAVLQVWRTIPADAHTCEYMRSGSAGAERFPLTSRASDLLYAAVCRSAAYVVPATPTASGWTPVAADGWRITGRAASVVVVLARE